MGWGGCIAQILMWAAGFRAVPVLLADVGFVQRRGRTLGASCVGGRRGGVRGWVEVALIRAQDSS